MVSAMGVYIEPIKIWRKKLSSEKHGQNSRSSLRKSIMISVDSKK